MHALPVFAEQRRAFGAFFRSEARFTRGFVHSEFGKPVPIALISFRDASRAKRRVSLASETLAYFAPDV